MLERIFAEIPITAINYIQFLADKINALSDKVDNAASPSVQNAVEKYIASNRQDDIVTVGSYTQLALDLNIGRASLYRALDALENEGKINRFKRFIKIK